MTRAGGLVGLSIGAVLTATPLWWSSAHAALVIGTGPTQNITCTASACSPTAADAVLNVGSVEAALGTGNLAITTTGAGGVEAGDIIFNAATTWKTENTLSLAATHSVTVNKVLSVAGKGALSVTNDSAGNGGQFAFGKRGRVRFRAIRKYGVQLTINGNEYALMRYISDFQNAIAEKSNAYLALADDLNANANGETFRASPLPMAFATIEGLGNTISNLIIVQDGTDGNPLVAFYADSEGSVSNLRLSNINIKAPALFRNGDWVAGLVAVNHGVIVNDDITGSVSAHHVAAGGLVGVNYGTISGSTAHVTVRGANAGGLVGADIGGAILTSSASGAVSSNSEIMRRVAIGGLAGLVSAGGSVDQCFATGSVTGVKGNHLGGLVGELSGADSSGTPSTVADSYAFGDVSVGQGEKLGGLIGLEDGGATSRAYSIGAAGGPHAGGYIGQNSGGANTAGYWDKVTSQNDRGVGLGAREGVTGVSTGQLKAGLPAGFDPAVWAEAPTINNGFPYLIAVPPQ